MNRIYSDSFLTDCKLFCEKYNKSDTHNLVLNGFRKRNKDVSFKSSRFAIFYYELGKVLGIKEKRLFKFVDFITFLADICHSADDLKDTTNLNIHNSIAKIRSLLIHYEGMKCYLDALNLEYDSIKRGFLAGIKLFKKEEDIKNNLNTSEKDVYDILKIGSPDFQIYNDLLAQLNPRIDRTIFKFLKEYAFVDLVLDHISDVEADLKNGSFNPLQVMLNQNIKEINIAQLPYHLVTNRIYDYFSDLCLKKGRHALALLQNKGPISKLLCYFMNGELEGLNILIKYNYLLDFPNREKAIYLLLKPHPWELYTYEEVFS